MASQPTNGYKVADRSREAPFVPDFALYMEPSDFGYAGLKKQRDEGAYDNFLRSNIDNEQDKRNFQTEEGRDHLPFRSYETASTTAHASVKNKIPTTNPGPAIVAAPGVPYTMPLRWNNPHSSELEVNVWIMGNKYVVPIRKPTCSGEGHQDVVFQFTVPSDFNELGSRVPDFAGCKKVGDCVLQIYAHSVESRTYAIGTPLIVNGTVTVATATGTSGIAAARADTGLAFTGLRKICLSSGDSSADITTSTPRFARLISDVYNHAYQNSDFSPYSGQQPEAISQNLQASCIIKMVTGDRGELGKTKLKKDNINAFNFQKKIENKANELIRIYESIANQIIEAIGDLPLSQNNDTTMANKQKTATCFRCAEVGSVTTIRQTTNTYVPSFQIATAYVIEARRYVADVYKNLIDANGVLQIYTTVLQDMNALFIKASALGLDYQGPAIKSTLTALADATKFRKVDAAGKADGGYYAATEAAKIKAIQKLSANGITSPLDKLISSDTAAFITKEEDDMNALNYDSNCDDDKIWTVALSGNCTMKGANVAKATQLFVQEGQEATATSISAASAPTSSWALATTVTLAVIASLCF